MIQTGYIVEIVDSNTAKMKMKRMSACAACGKCPGSKSHETQDIVVDVDNTIGAEVGDHVEVDMDNINVMKATALVYVLPLVALMLGVFIPYGIMKSMGVKGAIEPVSGIIGIVVMLLSYLYLKANDKKFKESKKYVPKVVRVLIDIDL